MSVQDDVAGLDWTDVTLHLAAGAAVGVVLMLPAWAGLAANALFWLSREALQRMEKNQPMSRLVSEPQVLLEWAAPAIAAPAAFLIAGVIAP